MILIPGRTNRGGTKHNNTLDEETRNTGKTQVMTFFVHIIIEL